MGLIPYGVTDLCNGSSLLQVYALPSFLSILYATSHQTHAAVFDVRTIHEPFSFTFTENAAGASAVDRLLKLELRKP